MTLNPSAQSAVTSAPAGQQVPAGPGGSQQPGQMQNAQSQHAHIQPGQSQPGQQQTGMTPTSVLPLKPHTSGAGQEHRGDEERMGAGFPAHFARLPVELTVAVPLRGFRIRNLLAMSAGAVIATQWAHGEDLPLASGDVQLAWSEFEVVETRLAVRVTRLA